MNTEKKDYSVKKDERVICLTFYHDFIYRLLDPLMLSLHPRSAANANANEGPQESLEGEACDWIGKTLEQALEPTDQVNPPESEAEPEARPEDSSDSASPVEKAGPDAQGEASSEDKPRRKAKPVTPEDVRGAMEDAGVKVCHKTLIYWINLDVTILEALRREEAQAEATAETATTGEGSPQDSPQGE